MVAHFPHEQNEMSFTFTCCCAVKLPKQNRVMHYLLRQFQLLSLPPSQCRSSIFLQAPVEDGVGVLLHRVPSGNQDLLLQPPVRVEYLAAAAAADAQLWLVAF